jgi:hypothetical protein
MIICHKLTICHKRL